MAQINDWKEVPIDDWQEVSVGPTSAPQPPQATGQQRSWSSVPGEAAGNIIPSGWNFLKGIGQMFATSPVEIAKNIGKTAIGGAELLIPGEQSYEPFARALGQFYTNRYGGEEAIKGTMATDPVGFLTDVSSVFSGGAASVSKIPTIGKTLAGVGTKAAEFTNPISLMSKTADIPLNIVSKTNIPESLYRRAMKIPPGSVSAEGQAGILKTLVRNEGIPLNSKALDKMNAVVSSLETDINASISLASQGGATADINRLMSSLDGLKFKYKNRRDPAIYSSAIESVKRDLIEHDFNNKLAIQQQVQSPSNILNPQGQPYMNTQTITNYVSTGDMALDKAHKLKKGLYTEIQDYYMKRQKPETGRTGIQNDAEAEAMAEAARILRSEVIDNPAVPTSVKAQMAREAGLMNARKWVERATNRGNNLDVASLSGMMFGVLVERGIPGMTAFRIAMSQPAQSRLAIALSKKRIGINPVLSNTVYQIENIARPGND